ncbi:MAG: peptide ABC transporter substrate-binding protein [Spirochaetes bacterium]|nr:peptide ABC transporter substrate-binding protein [Spirochaetota bacterium]
MKKALFLFLALAAVVSLGAQDFIMSNGAEPTLDPTLMTDVASTNVGIGLFEGLMAYDPKTNLGTPGVAESYKVSPDGLKVTFILRKTATWSDGTRVTAKDFVYAMKRILDPATGAEYAYMPAMVIKGAQEFNEGKGGFEDVGIKAINDTTVEYSLTGAAPYFADMTAHSAFWPVPQSAVEKYGTDWTKPGNILTNGPYLLKEWKPQEYVLLEKNAKYWDQKNVKIKSIKIYASDNDSTNYNMYKNGEVDWMHGIALSKIDEIKLRKDYQTSAQVGTYYYCFNVTRKPVDDVRVRKALAAAIDKKTLVDKVTKGGQIPTDSWVPPMAGYVPQKGIGFNPEEAKKLLAAAGYPGGKDFPTLTIVYNTNEGHKAIAEYIQQQWKNNLGIDVTLQNMEFKTFLDLRGKAHDFTIARHGWIGDYLDPNTMLDLFMTGSGNNDGLYADPEYDKLIENARLAKGAARMKILQQADAMYLTRDQGMIPIYHYANQDLIDTTKWGGWYATPLGFHSFKYMFKK